MKTISSVIFLVTLLTGLFSCSETHTINIPPIPTETNYQGVMEVRKTDGTFAKTQIPGTTLEAGNYKIIVFPKELELRSYYVKADAQGNIDVEYRLREEITVEPGYDGTVFGMLEIINTSRTRMLHVPVGYLP